MYFTFLYLQEKSALIINLVNISKVFIPFSRKYRLTRDLNNRRAVLQQVNIEVKRGEIISLLGKNGSGKTTLLKICCGLLIPDTGQVIYGNPAPRIGFIDGEGRGFYPRLTGGQNLDFFLGLTGLRLKSMTDRLAEIGGFLGLDDILEKPFQLMSTGEKQRLHILLTLLLDNNLLLFDELTKSLDPVASEWIKKFVKAGLAGRLGQTILWVTHNVSEALEMGHRIVILKQGRAQCLKPPLTAEKVLEEM